MEAGACGAGVVVGAFGDVEDHAGRRTADLIGEGAIVPADLGHQRPHLLEDRESLSMNLKLHGRVIGQCSKKLRIQWEVQEEG